MTLTDIKVGYSCNNNCIHCVIACHRDDCHKNGIPEDRTASEFKKEIYLSKLSGYNAVTITGGEPTIRKDIFNLVTYAKNLGYDINMQTNARMFSYKKFCQRMVAIADIRYIIAIHGHDSSLHDSITRCKSSFNQTVQGIRNLISLGQKVIIKTVISKKNYAHLLDVAKLCDSLGIKEISFAFPHAEGNAWKYFDEVVPKYSEIKDAVSKSIDFCNKKGILTTFETMPYCMMRGHEKHVLDSRICRNEGSQLKQIGMIPLDWDRVRKQIKRKFEKCKRCKYDNTCEGPWKEYADKFGSEEFEPIIS